MLGLSAVILKIDFNYKIAQKIRVWTKSGQSFCPFKCIVTIQNEDGLTVFWKALKFSESFSEIETDLIRLRDRLNSNLNQAKREEMQRKARSAAELRGEDVDDTDWTKFNVGVINFEQAVKVVWVDNCCSVKHIVRRCFPDVLIKLDSFHWLKRWNEIILKPSSAQAGVFRGLMSRALFNIEPGEFQRAKDYLEAKKNREVTVKEILKEANAMIPDAATLRENVQAVIQYIEAKDAQTTVLLATRREEDTSPIPQMFFKQSRDKVKVMREQFGHIDNNCLSDPPQDLVNIFRYNPKTGITYVARGTNTNERDNLDLAENVLSATHIGIHRAERLMCCFFERKNISKSIARLGDVDYGTYELEKLLLLNSYAHSIGYPLASLPYSKLSAPTVNIAAQKEYMGFEYRLSRVLHRVTNPTARASADVNYGSDDEAEDSDDHDAESSSNGDDADMADNLRRMHGTDEDLELDVEVLLDDADIDEVAVADNERYVDRQVQQAEEAQKALLSDRKQQEEIQNELRKLLPDVTGRENTLEAFQRLTCGESWIPFRSPNSSTEPTEIEKEESDVFERMQVNYQRDGRSTASNYKAFERDWNNEVSRRFRLWSRGDDSVIQIRVKSRQQLQQYFDDIKEHNSLHSICPSNANGLPDGDQTRLNQQLQNARNGLPPLEPPHHVQPPTFRTDGLTPYGNPTTLNANVTVGAVQRATVMQVPQAIAAPFHMNRQQLKENPPAQPVRYTFKSRKYCKKCAFPKRAHVVAVEGVGDTCIRNYCGRCRALEEHHGNTGFGRTCRNAVHPWCKKHVDDWYEKKVRYLYYCCWYPLTMTSNIFDSLQAELTCATA
jgi:hypothetical protein